MYFKTMPTFIALSETWLNSNDESRLSKFEVPGYTLESECRTSHGHGGVGIYIRKNIKYKVLQHDVQHAESLWMELPELKVNGDSVVLGVIYSTMIDRDMDDFVLHLEDVLRRIVSTKRVLVLTGDFNIDILKTKLTDQYGQLLLGTGIKNIIKFPTRYSDNNGSILDHILVNIDHPSIEMTAGVIDFDISDHQMTFINVSGLSLNRPQVELETSVKIFDFKNYSKEAMCKDLSEIDWALLDLTDVDKGFEKFVERLRAVQEIHLPLIERKIKHKRNQRQPWITADLKFCIKRRYQLYKRSKARPNNELLRTNYKRYRNWLCSTIKHARNDYNKALLVESKGDPKKTWMNLKKIIGASGDGKGGAPPEKITLDGKSFETPVEVCKALNNHFTLIGPKLSAILPPTNNNPLDYDAGINGTESFFIRPVISNEVWSKLLKMKTNKAIGADLIHPKIVVDGADYLAGPLANIINESFLQGVVPTSLKVARIVPVHKGGPKSDPSNYRPISILSMFSKLFEGFICAQLREYFDKHGILVPDQYGFQPKTNTKDAMIKFISEVQTGLENKAHVLACYIDLKKAFDTVDHKILLGKLEKYGVRGVGLAWFKNYLTNRMQFVKCGSFESNSEVVQCGVPQGSNLGPLLFRIYINDVVQCLQFSKAVLFADDTTLYIVEKNKRILVERMNDDLQRIGDWLDANKLSLNIAKTQLCHYHRKEKNAHILNEVRIKGQLVTAVGSVKYLGIHVDTELNWNNHIEYIISKIGKYAGIIGKVRRSLTPECIRLIYFSFVHSHLSYSTEIWGQCYPTTLKPLVTLQKKIIRIMYAKPPWHPTQALFNRHNIKRIEREIQDRFSILAYDVVAGNPRKFTFIGVNLNHPHTHPTRFSESNVRTARHSTIRHGDLGLIGRIIYLYNALPQEVKNLDPPNTKKARLVILRTISQ
jgi:hypothetical protein